MVYYSTIGQLSYLGEILYLTMVYFSTIGQLSYLGEISVPNYGILLYHWTVIIPR